MSRRDFRLLQQNPLQWWKDACGMKKRCQVLFREDKLLEIREKPTTTVCPKANIGFARNMCMRINVDVSLRSIEKHQNAYTRHTSHLLVVLIDYACFEVDTQRYLVECIVSSIYTTLCLHVAWTQHGCTHMLYCFVFCACVHVLQCTTFLFV